MVERLINCIEENDTDSDSLIKLKIDEILDNPILNRAEKEKMLISVLNIEIYSP